MGTIYTQYCDGHYSYYYPEVGQLATVYPRPNDTLTVVFSYPDGRVYTTCSNGEYHDGDTHTSC